MNAPDLGLRVNPDWANLPLFDRSKWKPVRFGDVVRVLKEQVDPSSGEVERYVAGEHMDSESIHIRRWGTVGEGYLGPAFIRRFRRGQVLYGSRRTYLKKVAVADWDGVTANTTLVLETVSNRMIQELLPWLMLSERFTRHSIQESKGSTNPYINWPDIAKFEFDLPPPEQQPRLYALLGASDGNTQSTLQELEAARVLKGFLMENTTRMDEKGRAYALGRLEKLLEMCQYGLSIPLHASGPWPVLRMMNYDEELVAPTDLSFADVSPQVFKEFRVERGDILFNRTNSAALVGKVGIFDLEGDYLFASYLVRLRVNKHIIQAKFLNYFLNSESGQRAVRAFATPGVSQTNISAGNLQRVNVPVPSIARQTAIVEAIDQAAAAARLIRTHVSRASQVTQDLANAIFT